LSGAQFYLHGKADLDVLLDADGVAALELLAKRSAGVPIAELMRDGFMYGAVQLRKKGYATIERPNTYDSQYMITKEGHSVLAQYRKSPEGKH
jgi:hypothetical protein